MNIRTISASGRVYARGSWSRCAAASGRVRVGVRGAGPRRRGRRSVRWRTPDRRRRPRDRKRRVPRAEQPDCARGPKGRGAAAAGRDARGPDRQDRDARDHRSPQPPGIHEPEDGRVEQGELHARDDRRSPAALRVLRRRGDDEHGPRPVGREPGAAVPAAERGHPQRRAVPHRRPRDCRHADGRPDGVVSPGRAVRRAERGRRTERGRGTGRAQSAHHQDLGGRSPRHRPEAAAERLPRDHRRSPQAQHARRRAHLRAGGRQGSAEGGRGRVRARRPRQGHRRRVHDDRQAAPERVGGAEPARAAGRPGEPRLDRRHASRRRNSNG